MEPFKKYTYYLNDIVTFDKLYSLLTFTTIPQCSPSSSPPFIFSYILLNLLQSNNHSFISKIRPNHKLIMVFQVLMKQKKNTNLIHYTYAVFGKKVLIDLKFKIPDLNMHIPTDGGKGNPW